MKRLFSARTLAAAALALGAVGVASVAHARSDVILSIGLNAPYGYGYVQPAPVYVEPQPVYVQPQPVYVQPRPVYVQPQTLYYGHGRRWERTGAYGDWDRDGIANSLRPRLALLRCAPRPPPWRLAARPGPRRRAEPL